MKLHLLGALEMPKPSLDMDRRKDLAVAVWRNGGFDTLVKIMSFGARPQPVCLVGYCSTIKYILGRTPAEMEQILGFASDSKLRGGAEVFLVAPLPRKHEFELRGYTHLPGGLATDDARYKPHPAYPPGLGAPQWDLDHCSQARLHHLATVGPNEIFRYPVRSLPMPY